MPFMVEGGHKIYETRAEANAAARERVQSRDRKPVAILELKPVAVCEGHNTGIRHRVAMSSELTGPLGWLDAINKTREASFKTTIKEV